jgi:hypothetical protein
MGKQTKLTPALRKRLAKRYALQITVTALPGGGVTAKLIPDTVFLKNGDYVTLPESTRWFGSLACVKREYPGSHWCGGTAHGAHFDHISGWMIDGAFIQCCHQNSQPGTSMGYWCELPDHHPGMHDWEATAAKYERERLEYEKSLAVVDQAISMVAKVAP